MTRPFFEVFPELHLDQDEQALFESAAVTRVSTNRAQDKLRIYVESDHLIDKSAVYKTEREIIRQMFNAHPVEVRIHEQFHLSSQYSLRSLMDLYLDSILTEFKTASNVEYTLLRDAEITYPAEDTMCLAIADTVVGRERAPEIKRVLERIITERCGLTAEVEWEFVEVEEDEDLPLEGVSSNLQVEGTPHQSAAPTASPQGEAKKYNKRGNRRTLNQRPVNPDVIYGRDFDGETTQILDLTDGIGDVVIQGRVIRVDERGIKNDRTIIMLDLYDMTDTITIKIFADNDDLPELKKEIKVGAFLLAKGMAMMDPFDHELSITHVRGIKKWHDFRTPRKDTAELKRIELHMHTKMSDMDGVAEASDIIHRAASWGMKGIAITDHAVAQGFPPAFHTWEKLDQKDDFKLIYGLDAYVVDDTKEIVVNGRDRTLESTYVVFDLETTGFSPVHNRIIEIGAVKIENGIITDRFSEFVNPHVPIPFHITNLTSITDDMVKDAPSIEEVLPRFVDFCGDAVMVGHNVGFDIGFIYENCRRQGIKADYTTIDTVGLSHAFFPQQGNHRLETVAKTLKVNLGFHHRAVDDAECTAQILLKFLPMIRDYFKYITEEGAVPFSLVNTLGADDAERIKRLRPFHATLLAQNETGRVNLYTMISISHLEFLYGGKPIIPKSVLMKHREGILVGASGLNGELMDNLTDERAEEELFRILNFYDYLEVLPPACYGHLLLDEKKERMNTTQDIEGLIRRIVKLGQQYGKTVVATSDAHFLDPEDEIYRRIIRFGKTHDDEVQGPFYLRTTDEMLADFGFLGSALAEEIVVNASIEIADSIEQIAPVRPDKCPPVIEHSDETLRELCESKAFEIYGDPLPPVVKERMERELNSIITNGFAVMYIIAQKLVWKSVEDGYLVGSRGSVGSSFAAFLSGITEVNALAPHYVCPSCKYSDFDSELVRSYAGNSGCDMPDCDCPKCGTKMKKDGFDIPFETFLGFKGDKEPDIDLNFSGEYQNKAHQYTEVIFGKGQTFRAGTIGTLADKTAYGIVKKYYEDKGVVKRNAEINRIIARCTGVRTGTGQHPGGIIVLPFGEDINSFTPVQHPANKDTSIITTHFDYHSIDHNLLKLDILGHDDPTMIRFLQDVTGIAPTDVPLDDPEVMQLFAGTEPLGITPQDIGGTKLGCLALPEFGTDFAMQMVIDAAPTSFSHLIRIAGLAHGTDVWLGNAEKLIKEGTATIDTAICTRDDIMLYLIQKGMDNSLSFKTMESVRKGKGLTDEMEEAMKAAGVPDWYIWSCKTIKYMFPKAHAAAYVMMAWRIAWFKVHHPKAFYAAWFSIRAKSFDYEMMCQGISRVKQEIARLKVADELSDVDSNNLYTMRVIEEMYARGIEFMPIDIYRARATSFQVIDGKIMPAFTAIAKLGESVGENMENAAREGRFLSRDDFRQRTHCSQTILDNMNELGLFGDLPATNQMSLFDLM